MSAFEKQIDKVRKYFEEHKAERYPFKNAALSEKDEYIKSLYFRMLCTLIRYTGEPGEMQVLYVRRLIAGSDAENEFQDYMKMASDLDTSDVDEFISVFYEDDLRYYFCIDGTILLSVAGSSDKNYELLAELIEMLGISRTELMYLASAAKAIVVQSSEMFDEAKDLAPDTIRSLSMYHYVQGFYAGTIVDTPEEIHIYSCDKSEVDLSQYGTLTNKKVVIENVSISLQSDIVFSGCEEVIIKNCAVTIGQNLLSFQNTEKILFEDSLFEYGSSQPIKFESCADIQIRACIFRNFTSRTIRLEKVSKFTVDDTLFENCKYDTGRMLFLGPVRLGALVYSDDIFSNVMSCFNRCSFINCGGRGFSDSNLRCFISNITSELTECKFKNCWYYGENKATNCNMFPSGSKAVSCEVINSANITE